MPKPNDRQEIEALKAKVPLNELFQLYGIQVGYKGAPNKALCPWHEETKPSLSVNYKKGLFKCFGCGKSGDHLTFLQEHLKLTFPKAVAELKRLAGQVDFTLPPVPAAPAKPVVELPYPQELVTRLAEVWHQAFCERPEGLAYLESRGLKDKEMLRLFQVGYCDGDQLLAMITADEKKELQRLAIINERGNVLFSNCVVFPLKDGRGQIKGFYGRATLSGAKVPHRFCGGPRLGFFYPEAARGAQKVFLVEGVLDALAFYQAGFPNVIALGGTHGTSDVVLEHLRKEKVRQVAICLDGDEPGQIAAESLRGHFVGEGFKAEVITLPDGEDPVSFFPTCPRAELEARFRSDAPKPAPESPAVFEEGRPMAEEPQLEKRFRKLSGAQGKLKVYVSLSQAGVRGEATVDLYSARSRRHEASHLARRLGLDADELEQWFFQVMGELEERKDAEKAEGGQGFFAKVEVPEMTPQQRAEALVFLRRPDLVEAMMADLETLGYMGDPEAKLLGYLVGVSRKLDKPMSAIIRSGSGAGKSHLSEIIERLTPPEEVVFYSRLSQQALYHMPADFLVHKLLLLEERVGSEGSDYQIRTLQSKSKLVQAIVVKDPATGRLFTRQNEVYGPIAYIETTTSLRLNPENTSRCFEIPLDESPEQTARIHQRQKVLKSLEGLRQRHQEEELVARHHNAQRLLEPVSVVIPYVEHLTFPDRWLRTRRDHERFLCLIEVLTFLHQHQRERKRHNGVEYIEANLEDYRWAYFLANRVLQCSLDGFSRWGRELFSFFEGKTEQTLTRREVRETLQWPDHRTRNALEELVEMEHLETMRGANNTLFFRLALANGNGHVNGNGKGLIHPDELARRFR